MRFVSSKVWQMWYNNYSLCIIKFVLLRKAWYILKFDNQTKSFEKYCDNGNRLYLHNNSFFIKYWKEIILVLYYAWKKWKKYHEYIWYYEYILWILWIEKNKRWIITQIKPISVITIFFKRLCWIIEFQGSVPIKDMQTPPENVPLLVLIRFYGWWGVCCIVWEK